MNGEDAPVLKIATDYDFCPNSYINKEGDLSGLYIEVMTEAVNRLGMKPVFETSNWMGCRKMLTDGDVDVLPGLEIFSNMEGTLRTILVCSDELRVYGKKKIDILLEYQEKLKRSNEEKQQANRAKSEFLSHMSYDIQHPYLLGSPAHLRRILLNLISNALRYNKPEGSIDVYISELNSDDRYALFELKVQDTGIGMSREFLEKSLFKPFTQEDDRVRTEYHGTGLGMSIVKELVTGMNGTIQAESEPGKGTTFTIRLSLKINQDAIQQQNVLEKQSHDISGMRLLVAEDNQLNLEIVLYMLESEGAEVMSVQNGQESVEAFEASAPGTYDAILMDIMMPVMDGLEAARKIRGLYRKDAGTIPIIARYKKI